MDSRSADYIEFALQVVTLLNLDKAGKIIWTDQSAIRALQKRILSYVGRNPEYGRIFDQYDDPKATSIHQEEFVRLLGTWFDLDADFYLEMRKLLVNCLEEQTDRELTLIPTTDSSQEPWDLDPNLSMGLEDQFEAEAEVEDVNFTTLFPKQLRPDNWYNLLTYIHVPSAISEILEDSQQYFEDQNIPKGKSSSGATSMVERGSEIVIQPELAGCDFNPRQAAVTWLEDWQRVNFRVRPNLDQVDDGFPVIGKVNFFVGTILVAETKIWAEISLDAKLPKIAKNESNTAGSYRSIFVSYSHQDEEVVETLSVAYRALGMEYLRDVDTLRSGESWNPALLKMIERADIFQLYWSENAEESTFVKQEWEYALSLNRPSFIRPVFWRKPMPVPPDALNQFHFTNIKLSN